MRKALTLAVAAIAVFAASAIRAEEKGHEGHNHGAEAKAEAKGHDEHKGNDHNKAEKIEKKVLTIKGVALIELAHDAKDGEVTLTIMDDKKKPLAPTKAPRLNLIVDGKNKQIKTKAITGETTKFVATDDVLKKQLNGKVSIKIADKSHQVAIDPHANCDHGAEGHGQ